MVVDSSAAGDGSTEEEAATCESSQSSEIDELVFMKENVRLGPFQTQILECRTKPLLGEECPGDGDAFESRQVTARGMAFAPWIACVACIHET